MTNPVSNPKTALEYLAAGEEAIAVGKRADGCLMLWKAVESTFQGLADKHDLDMNRHSLSEIARALDVKEGIEYHYLGGLSTGQCMKHNGEFDYMGPNELEMVINGVRKFVLTHA